MATERWVSASLILVTTRKFKITFPVFTIGTILADLIAIIFGLAVPDSRKLGQVEVEGRNLPVIWAARAITITAVVVSVPVTAIILARGIITTTSAPR